MISPSKMLAFRRKFGMNLYEWGVVLGLESARTTTRAGVARAAKKLETPVESDGRPASMTIERLIKMYERHGIPPEFRPDDPGRSYKPRKD